MIIGHRIFILYIFSISYDQRKYLSEAFFHIISWLTSFQNFSFSKVTKNKKNKKR
ncbi:hypothetical protein HMPREF0813_01225 [Streptococcus anginosus F0211]|uniref:Uncharacterized protein n=1 Tax=Streptococcus anginosus F0211 TaxID=706437 RepID=E6J1U6_STRAP|nr:hypothetical protein HMPREF0813_01225 [Streptococcus anginosus F0211]